MASYEDTSARSPIRSRNPACWAEQPFHPTGVLSSARQPLQPIRNGYLGRRLCWGTHSRRSVMTHLSRNRIDSSRPLAIGGIGPQEIGIQQLLTERHPLHYTAK